MADLFRYRYGDTNPVQLPYKSAVAVSIGDLCYEDSADGYTVKPASQFTWGASLAATQASFVALFVGVSAQHWDGTNPTTGSKDGLLRIDTGGVFEFDCAAATFNPGDYVGPDKDVGNNLLSQQVVAVADFAHAIGRVEKLYSANATKILVRMFTRKFAPQ